MKCVCMQARAAASSLYYMVAFYRAFAEYGFLKISAGDKGDELHLGVHLFI